MNRAGMSWPVIVLLVLAVANWLIKNDTVAMFMVLVALLVHIGFELMAIRMILSDVSAEEDMFETGDESQTWEERD